jgi:hypothetical protein
MSPSDRPPLLTLKCYAFAQNLFIVDKFHGKYQLIAIAYFQTGQHGWQPQQNKTLDAGV